MARSRARSGRFQLVLLAMSCSLPPVGGGGALRGRPLLPRDPALAAVAVAGAWELQEDCGPEGTGFGARLSPEGAAAALRTCGVVLLRGAISAADLAGVREAFARLLTHEQRAAPLRYGRLRPGREQTHLPFAPPFDAIPLLGRGEALLSTIEAALGEAFGIDLVTVVSVSPGARSEDPHRDTPLSGSLAMQLPLEPVVESFAPLGLCGGTSALTKAEAKPLMREAMLHHGKDESVEDAQRRLLCGGRQRSQRFELRLTPERSHPGGAHAAGLRLGDGRLGARILALETSEAAALPWQVGDEITAADGRDIVFDSDVAEVLEEAGARDVVVTLERPELGAPPAPERLLVGAPMALGDALLYDSRTYQWGTANRENRTRHDLYVNFKVSAEHPGVHPEAHGSEAFRTARLAFQQHLTELRQAAVGKVREL